MFLVLVGHGENRTHVLYMPISTTKTITMHGPDNRRGGDFKRVYKITLKGGQITTESGPLGGKMTVRVRPGDDLDFTSAVLRQKRNRFNVVRAIGVNDPSLRIRR